MSGEIRRLAIKERLVDLLEEKRSALIARSSPFAVFA